MCPANSKDNPKPEIHLWTSPAEAASSRSKPRFDPLQAQGSVEVTLPRGTAALDFRIKGQPF